MKTVPTATTPAPSVAVPQSPKAGPSSGDARGSEELVLAKPDPAWEQAFLHLQLSRRPPPGGLLPPPPQSGAAALPL